MGSIMRDIEGIYKRELTSVEQGIQALTNREILARKSMEQAVKDLEAVKSEIQEKRDIVKSLDGEVEKAKRRIDEYENESRKKLDSLREKLTLKESDVDVKFQEAVQRWN